MLFVNTAGVETSTIAIALAILQAPQLKHCSYPNCKREDCIAVKSDYEQLFEIFFKEKARTLGFQKARGEMSAAYDVVLSLPTKESMKEPEPEPVSLTFEISLFLRENIHRLFAIYHTSSLVSSLPKIPFCNT